MRSITTEEIRKFLETGARTGKLATTRSDRRPHVVPVWFVLDGDDLVFNTGARTVKGTNLAREGRAAMVVDDERPPFAYVSVEGPVTISDDLDAMLSWATAIGGRYMGAEAAEAFGKRNAVEGELLVRLSPTTVIARTGITD